MASYATKIPLNPSKILLAPLPETFIEWDPTFHLNSTLCLTSPDIKMPPQSQALWRHYGFKAPFYNLHQLIQLPLQKEPEL